MKYFKLILLFTIFSTSSVMLSSCADKKDTTEQQGKEYTSKYICPMHCEGSGSDKMGTCPVCGMDYVKNEEHEEHKHAHDDHDGHDHSHGDHDGHDHSHDDHDGHDH